MKSIHMVIFLMGLLCFASNIPFTMSETDIAGDYSYETDEVFISASEIQIKLPEAAITGYVMVLLSNNPYVGWEAGIMISLNDGETVHYVLGDPASNDSTWAKDITGGHHELYGDRLVFKFSEYQSDISTNYAVLSILSENHVWMPAEYEGTTGFIPFEKYLNGMTTKAVYSEIVGPIITSPSNLTESSSSSSTISESSSTPTNTKGDTDDDIFPGVPLDFSFSMVMISMTFMVIFVMLKRKYS